MDGIAIHLACRSSGEVFSCDLDALDQGTVTDSSSSSSLCPTPMFASVSKTEGLVKPFHAASDQASTISSRSSSLLDSVTLLDTEEATAPQQQQAEAAQICFDFTKGMCTRGDKCKYSHDIATIVHFNSKEKGICFDYLRNQCHRGLLCRFSHDLSNIAQQCQVYSGTTAATAANKNRSASICYDFVKGVCTRGSECRYSHDLTLIARMARSSTGVHVDQGQQADVCFDYIRGRCSRGDTCKYSHNPAALHNPAAAHLLALDPTLMTPWQLPGLNPQAAAAAAAAMAAAGGVGPAAPLNPFAAAAAAANMGAMNPFARPGMFGLGADHLAAAASLASSPAGPAGLLCGGLGPLLPPGGGLMGTLPLARHCSLEGSACGTPTQITDAMKAAAAAAADPLALLTAMQQQQGLAATAAVTSAAAAACSVPAMPLGVAGGLDPLQMMLSADINRLLPKGPGGTVNSPTSLGLRPPYYHAPHGPPSAAGGLPPGALLPTLNPTSRFAPAGMTAPLKVTPPAAGSFIPSHVPYDSIGSKLSPDIRFPAGATANRPGLGLPPRAGSAVPASHAAQQAPVGAATHLGRAASAPIPSQLQLQQVVGPRPAIAAATGAPRQAVGGLTASSSASCFNPLAAGLSHLSIGNQGAADCAQEVGRAKSADVGSLGTNANRCHAGGAVTPGVVPLCDGEGVGRPETARVSGGDCEFPPDAVNGSRDELDTGHEIYGDLLPRIQAIWSR